MSRIAIIPARGGSVRIPRKNINLFYGKPIIAYSIDVALRSKLFSSVIVSTDDEEICRVSKGCGATVIWRDHDDGKRGTQEVARDVLLSGVEMVDFACVIYSTAPMMVVADLERGYAVLNGNAQMLYAMSVQADPLADAGCFYWGRGHAFAVGAPLIDSHTLMVPMPSNRVCDINTPEDWERAERMYAAWRGIKACPA